MFDWLRDSFNNLLSRKDPVIVPSSPLEADTAPLTNEQLKAITQATKTLEPAQLHVCSARSVGRQRDHNEDALFSFTATLAGNNSSLPLGVYIIADGMGGHNQGEVASEIAVRSMANYLIQRLYLPLYGLEPEKPHQSIQEIMEEGVNEAHQVVLKKAPGGGTTMTAVLIMGKRMTIAHVGDSRAYAIYPDGRMQVLTRDHSLVNRLEELGQITPEEANTHPHRHVLYRALGLGEPFEPDVFTAQMPNQGYVLVCSDGLWGVLPEAEIYRLISSSPTLAQACHDLIDAANAAGGPDNISAILVNVPT